MRADGRLRMVVATPVDEELCAWMERAEPRLDLVRDHDLLAVMRHPGDHSGDPGWRRSALQQERFDRLVDSAQALYGIPDVSPPALARTVRANPDLRWVQTMAAGGAAQVAEAGLVAHELSRLTITTSAGVHAGPLAEFALLGLLAGAKDVPRLLADARTRTWPGRWTMRHLSEQTVLVVGLGSLGREIVRLLSQLGARVIVANRTARPVEGVHRTFTLDELASAARQADALVVCLPGAAGTSRLVDAAVLGNLRPGATVVNVGRGTVVDEPALIEALSSGQVGFAALDVAAVEPLPVESPLWGLPNVLLSPHTAALSTLEDRRIAELAVENATRLLDGLPLRNVLRASDLA